MIRALTADDYEAAIRLWRETPGVGLRAYDDSREGVARFLARNPSTCFAAEAGGELVGTILCGHDGRRGAIYHLAVSEAHRRRGFGGDLVRAACGALRREGIAKANLVSYRENAAGNAFWDALGFRERLDLSYRDRDLTEDV